MTNPIDDPNQENFDQTKLNKTLMSYGLLFIASGIATRDGSSVAMSLLAATIAFYQIGRNRRPGSNFLAENPAASSIFRLFAPSKREERAPSNIDRDTRVQGNCTLRNIINGGAHVYDLASVVTEQLTKDAQNSPGRRR